MKAISQYSAADRPLARRQGYLLLYALLTLLGLATVVSTVLGTPALVILEDMDFNAGFVVVPLAFEQAASENVAAMQFDVLYDAERFGVYEVQAGAAVAQAYKDVIYNEIDEGRMRVIVSGFSQDAITSGELTTIVFYALDADKSLLPFRLGVESLLMADAFGNQVEGYPETPPDALEETRAVETPAPSAINTSKETSNAEEQLPTAGPQSEAAGDALSPGGGIRGSDLFYLAGVLPSSRDASRSPGISPIHTATPERVHSVEKGTVRAGDETQTARANGPRAGSTPAVVSGQQLSRLPDRPAAARSINVEVSEDGERWEVARSDAAGPASAADQEEYAIPLNDLGTAGKQGWLFARPIGFSLMVAGLVGLALLLRAAVFR